jgi:hypothetical protein
MGAAFEKRRSLGGEFCTEIAEIDFHAPKFGRPRTEGGRFRREFVKSRRKKGPNIVTAARESPPTDRGFPEESAGVLSAVAHKKLQNSTAGDSAP